MARVIALMTLAALGLSEAPVHGPVTRGDMQYPRIVTQRNGRLSQGFVRRCTINVRRSQTASSSRVCGRARLSPLQAPVVCGPVRVRLVAVYQKIPQAFVHAVRIRAAFPVTGSTR
jgi:hypothetical protein